MFSSLNVKSIVSGSLGATASCFGKMAFDPQAWTTVWARSVCPTIITRDKIVGEYNFCDMLILFLRGIFFVAMLGCNALMLGSFLEGLDEAGSVAGTALATAANFVVSAIYGQLLWGESFSIMWLIGFLLVVAGGSLLSRVKILKSNKIAKKTE